MLTVTGRLATDPARRDTTKGVVCEFRIAVDGHQRLWLPVTCWGHLAGTCKQYLRRGRRIAASGSLCATEYIANGENQTRLFLRAERVTFLDGTNSTDESRISHDAGRGAVR
ncbi:MAG: single-stranded DNA-binding protein [Ilumatobacteraceae bacterium]